MALLKWSCQEECLGEACGMCGEDIQDIGGENVQERGHLEDLDLDGRIILILICKKYDGG